MIRRYISAVLALAMALCLFASCAGDTAVQAPVVLQGFTGEARQFDVNEFVARYQKAADDIKNGKKPAEPAPTDITKSGFSVTKLNKEIYGTSAFAVLPLIARDMTDEELLQLADAMQDVDPKDIASPKYCYIGYPYQEWTYQDNAIVYRETTWTENIKLSYDLAEKYCHQKLRPQSPLSNKVEDGGVIVTQAPDASGKLSDFWICPNAEMTDEQILQIIDYTYSRLPKEQYMPSFGKFKYDKVEPYAKEVLVEYGITDEQPEYCYIRYRTYREELLRGKWYVSMHFKQGYDYAMELSADFNGQLMSWSRKPQGKFAKAKPEGYVEELSPAAVQKPTDEQVKKAAGDYISTYFGKEIEKVQLHEYSEENHIYYLSVYFSNGSYFVNVAENDLSIVGFLKMKQY